MSFARPLRTLRPVSLSILGISLPSSFRPFFSSSSASSGSGSNPGIQCTRRLIRNPSPIAPRESPTPLIFVRAKGLAASYGLREEDGGSTEAWEGWSGMFAEKGWMGVEIDIEAGAAAAAAAAAETPSPGQDSSRLTPTSEAGSEMDITSAGHKTLLRNMASALNSEIRLLAIPFAPVLLASGASTLLTQAYISDYPASGLVMVSPPDAVQVGDKLFDYEPRFPILIVGDSQGQGYGRLGEASKNGVGRGGKGVEIVGVKDGVRGDKTRIEVERWMDRCGY